MSADPKVVVVTGASQGIGEGIVRGFLTKGYRVVANSRSITQGAFGSGAVVTIAGDIADPQVAGRIVTEAIERFGRIDTLVNNAGIFVAKPFVEYTADDFSRV